MTIEQVYNEALRLPDDAQETLVERLIHRMEENISPELERVHVDLVHQRREELAGDDVTAIPAADVLADVRREILG